MLKNYTPHKINVFVDDKEVFSLESLGVARVKVEKKELCKLSFTHNDNEYLIPLNKSSFGNVEGLPQSNNDDLFIVSRVVYEAMPERKDLICPDDTIRDNEGIIIGCRAFCRP